MARRHLGAFLVLAVAHGVHGLELEDALTPAAVWRFFDQIRGIPRCSGAEAEIKRRVTQIASDQGLATEEDAAGNVVVKRKGSGAGAQSQPVIVQGHLDMVCEKDPNFDHDWAKDAVRAVLRGGWLVADNTTLGADNGVGVALILALLTLPPEVPCPPLEAVFTVQEEAGLDGARGLDVSRLAGRRLLNFDSEEWGCVYIGCAGGGTARVALPVGSAELGAGMVSRELKVSGLQGGHSGADIHEDRGNALLLLARAVSELQESLPGLRLLQLSGGNLDNAIPREAAAVLGTLESKLQQLSEEVARKERELRQEFGRIDPGLALSLSAGVARQEGVPPPMDEASGRRLLDLLLLLPSGVVKRSHEVEGLVETSNNIASVEGRPGEAVVTCLARSSLDAALEHVRHRIARAAVGMGGEVTLGAAFSGWAPNRSQALLGVVEDAFEQVEGARPPIKAIHAGLECGVIGNKIPGIEMVSFGPDIVGAHAPGERVRVASVDRMVVVVAQVLRRLIGGPATRHGFGPIDLGVPATQGFGTIEL